MANSTTFTLTVHLDSNPQAISWFVTDSSMSHIIVGSESAHFRSADAYGTMNQTFTLPDDQSYIFEIRSSLGNGIHCNQNHQNEPCYTITTFDVVTGNQEPFLAGFGEFSCSERYRLGSNELRMQTPLYQGQSGLALADKNGSHVDWFIEIMVSLTVAFIIILIVAVVYCRRQSRRQMTRRLEELAVERETASKLYTARKESLKILLKKQGLYRVCVQSSVEVASISSDSEEASCPICLEAFSSGDELGSSFNKECRHMFHTSCILEWFLRDNSSLTCPLCRNDFTTHDPSGSLDASDNC